MPQFFCTCPFDMIDFSLPYKKLSLAPVPSPNSLPQGSWQKIWKKPAHFHRENVGCGDSESGYSTSRTTNQKEEKNQTTK